MPQRVVSGRAWWAVVDIHVHAKVCMYVCALARWSRDPCKRPQFTVSLPLHHRICLLYVCFGCYMFGYINFSIIHEIFHLCFFPLSFVTRGGEREWNIQDGQDVGSTCMARHTNCIVMAI
uniref:Uncharacterized protein n=1 Tax=Trypanosoma vivax (strain Y486) TaxID=1055687 RepID=G0TWF8_TRYVY|nr:conserved hypothetical protein [Trypanosoma vivax Y486]